MTATTGAGATRPSLSSVVWNSSVRTAAIKDPLSVLLQIHVTTHLLSNSFHLNDDDCSLRDLV